MDIATSAKDLFISVSTTSNFLALKYAFYRQLIFSVHAVLLPFQPGPSVSRADHMTSKSWNDLKRKSFCYEKLKSLLYGYSF